MEALSYTVKKNKRARRVGLRISPRDGLVVTIPHGFDTARIPNIIHTKWDWIEKHEEILERSEETADTMLPEEIRLPSLRRTYRVEYRPTTASHVKVSERSGDTLVVYGAVKDSEKCLLALQRWLRRKAHDTLVPWIQDICDETGLVCDDVTIRNQRSRWASCSGKRAISLNLKMLFLPPKLVRYVLIHELCHTRHMNHSKAFWNFVGRFDPYYERHDRLLTSYWYNGIPQWVDFAD